MLEGLMQHDHPLTLQLVLERMRGMNGDAEVVTLREDGATRAQPLPAMTETSPLASVAHPPAASEGEAHWDYRSTAGR